MIWSASVAQHGAATSLKFFLAQEFTKRAVQHTSPTLELTVGRFRSLLSLPTAWVTKPSHLWPLPYPSSQYTLDWRRCNKLVGPRTVLNQPLSCASLHFRDRPRNQPTRYSSTRLQFSSNFVTVVTDPPSLCVRDGPFNSSTPEPFTIHNSQFTLYTWLFKRT